MEDEFEKFWLIMPGYYRSGLGKSKAKFAWESGQKDLIKPFTFEWNIHDDARYFKRLWESLISKKIQPTNILLKATKEGNSIYLNGNFIRRFK